MYLSFGNSISIIYTYPILFSCNDAERRGREDHVCLLFVVRCCCLWIVVVVPKDDDKAKERETERIIYSNVRSPRLLLLLGGESVVSRNKRRGVAVVKDTNAGIII